MPAPTSIIRPSRETIGERRLNHGHTRGRSASPTYLTWSAMLNRCTNPKQRSFAKYGARGITVCDRWRAFECFLADMGERPAGMTIDRIDGSLGYEPGNCRWATPSQQSRNRKTTRPVLRSDGARFPSMIDAAEAIGGNRRCIRDVCTGRQKSHLGFGWRYAE